jgi:hypothetical protein
MNHVAKFAKRHLMHQAIKVPEGGHPFVRLIFEEVNRHKISIQDLADRSGVSADGIRKWRSQRGCRLALVEAVLNSLGYEIVVRRMK